MGNPIKLIFFQDELIYDVSNYSFVEGDIMSDGEDNIHAQLQTFDIAQYGNYDRVTRILNLAHAECVEMLYPYTKKLVPESPKNLNNMLNDPYQYVIEMNLPDGFSMTTVELIKHLIHDYMVDRVMADWMSITNPKSQANWEDKLQRTKTKVQTALMSRRGHTRRRLHPF